MVKTRLTQWVSRWRERRLAREQKRQTSATRQATRDAEAQRYHSTGHGSYETSVLPHIARAVGGYRMSMGPLTRPVPEPGYVTAPICASGEARTAITSHSPSELWLMA